MHKQKSDHAMRNRDVKHDHGTDGDIFDTFERMVGWIAVAIYVIALGLVVWAIGGWW